MRPNNINPRTGLVVALVSVFLVFGFMSMVSGVRGETLWDFPLIVIKPAICLPGMAAMTLAKKTDGCTKWPPCPRDHCSPTTEDAEERALGRSGSFQDLSKNSTRVQIPDVEDGGSKSLIRKRNQEAATRYLETNYLTNVFNYRAFDWFCSILDCAFYADVYSPQ